VLGDRPIVNDVQTMRHDYTFRPGQWTLRDFDFEAPAKNLTANTVTVADIAQMAQHEIYDYPAGYTDQQAVKALTRRLIEAEEVQYDRLRGAGTAAGLDAGRRCEARFADPNTSRDDDEFLLTEVRHCATDHSYITNVVEPATYRNEFVATPVKVPFRPPQWTPRPIVRGPQTAVVTGPAGDQIYTDKYGRVKVRFPWDRNPDGNQDDVSSCWIRVSQVWAGRNWGGIHLPRIGQEVIVDFLEGDPDRPIITGRVYNGTNSVPYELPANATQSGIKSRSVPGSGSNEFRFEDKQGSEEIWMHAQKDLNAKVENNETREVGSNRTTTIKANETKTVIGNVSEIVEGTETRNVTGNVSETFSANETRTVSGNVSETVDGGVTTTVGGSRTETVAGSVTQTVTGGITITSVGPIVVNAPAGSTTLAPGGTTIVESTTKKTGTTNFQAYALSCSAQGLKADVSGLQVTYAANKIDITGMKMDVTGFKFEKKNMKCESFTQAIVVGALSIKTLGLIAFM
jgi:type VI secretion system secreted protein VgrG